MLTGHRRVWAVGVAVLLLACAGIFAALAEPRERLTGSNSVGIHVLGDLAPGELHAAMSCGSSPASGCASGGLAIPAGTGGIRFVAFWNGATPTFRVALQTPAGRRGGAVRPRRRTRSTSTSRS